jgi:hypothetical protein
LFYIYKSISILNDSIAILFLKKYIPITLKIPYSSNLSLCYRRFQLFLKSKSFSQRIHENIRLLNFEFLNLKLLQITLLHSHLNFNHYKFLVLIFDFTLFSFIAFSLSLSPSPEIVSFSFN